MKKFIKNNYKRFLEISFALAMVITVSSHALIYQALAIQWQKIFQESRQWQIASDAEALTNGTFTGDTSGWTLSVATYDGTIYQAGPGSVTTVTAVGRNKAATGTATHDSAISTNASDTVTLSFYWKKNCVYGTNPPVTNTISVQIQTSGGDWSSPTTLWTDTTLGVTDWTYVSQDVSGNFGTGNYDFRLYMEVKNGNDGTGQTFAWFDTVGLDVAAAANTAPTVSGVNLGTYPRGDEGINLVEGTDIEIRVSAQVDDPETCNDISGVKAYVFHSNKGWDYGEGTTCSFDYNDCYTPNFDSGVLDCVQDSCSGNTAIYDCTASASADGGDGMWFHATPTDLTASDSAEEWYAMVIASDSVGNDSFASNSVDVDVVMQAAIDLESTSSDSIDYGLINPGSESADTIARGVRNTGNRGINITIAATIALEHPTFGDIATGQQQYGLNDFEIGDGTSLSATATELDVDLNKPQSHVAGDNDDQIFWGIAIPVTTSPGDYEGQITYSTITD